MLLLDSRKNFAEMIGMLFRVAELEVGANSPHSSTNIAQAQPFRTVGANVLLRGRLQPSRKLSEEAVLTAEGKASTALRDILSASFVSSFRSVSG